MGLGFYWLFGKKIQELNLGSQRGLNFLLVFLDFDSLVVLQGIETVDFWE